MRIAGVWQQIERTKISEQEAALCHRDRFNLSTSTCNWHHSAYLLCQTSFISLAILSVLLLSMWHCAIIMVKFVKKIKIKITTAVDACRKLRITLCYICWNSLGLLMHEYSAAEQERGEGYQPILVRWRVCLRILLLRQSISDIKFKETLPGPQ